MKFYQPLLLCIALAAGFFAPDLINAITQSEAEVDLSQYCTLSKQPCTQSEVSMLLEHDIVRPLMPNTLSVQWPGSESDTLMIELEGLEMNMGIVKYQLKKQENGFYQTTLLLPVCTMDNMTWLGTISDGSKTVFPAIRMER